jgi:hypothetical protein
MKYLDRLRELTEKKEIVGGGVPPKLTKPSSVGFVSAVPRPKNISHDILDAPTTEEARLIDEVEAPLSPIQQAARQQVLAQLQANPTVQRAFVNRFTPDGTMIVTLAIRGIGTGELLIPAERFNPASLDDYGALLARIEGAP